MKLSLALYLALATGLAATLAAPAARASFFGTMRDLLAGEPSEEDLAERASYEGHGVRFDYPAVLRSKEADDSSLTKFAVERGMFELELNVSADGVDGVTYLEFLADMFGSSSKIETRALPGRKVRVCGTDTTSTRVEVTMLDDVSVYEAIDLPDAADGAKRFLVFDDDPEPPNEDEPSRTMAATRAMVLATIACE